MIAVLTGSGVEVTKDYGRVAFKELIERCVQVYVKAVNCCYSISAVRRVRIDNEYSLGFGRRSWRPPT